jgi:aryl-alcohol dehydrogenase-like predicted oxidoreductase
MKLRMLGRLGPVSEVGIGGGGIGQVYGAVDRKEAVATLQAAVASGVTLVDLAPTYGPGESSPEAELVFGRAFRGVVPADVLVTTKVVVDDLAPLSVIPQLIRTSIEDSLHRLRITRVDLLFLHSFVRPAGGSPLRETVKLATVREVVVPAFERLRDEGLIRAWGITGAAHPSAICALLESQPRPDAVQCVVNAIDAIGNMWPVGLDGRPDNRRVLRTAVRNSVPVMGVRALAGGALSDRLDRVVLATDPFYTDFRRAAKFRTLAREFGSSPVTLAYRYALSQEGVATVISGAKNRAELDECLSATEAPPLSPLEIAEIERTCHGDTNAPA